MCSVDDCSCRKTKKLFYRSSAAAPRQHLWARGLITIMFCHTRQRSRAILLMLASRSMSSISPVGSEVRAALIGESAWHSGGRTQPRRINVTSDSASMYILWLFIGHKTAGWWVVGYLCLPHTHTHTHTAKVKMEEDRGMHHQQLVCVGSSLQSSAPEHSAAPSTHRLYLPPRWVSVS